MKTARRHPAAVVDRRADVWRWHALAAVLFLVGALWSVRVVLPAPASTFPSPRNPPRGWQPIIQSDQKLSAANITWNAHRFLTGPWKLYDSGQCYPAADAATLGPHQLGEGLLGTLPYALTGDPVLTYNTVVVLTLWLPALAMYALVFSFTQSASAAFVAGLVFAFHPQRINDLMHPDVHGNQWTPLALLFAHRTLAGGRWRDAAGLTLFLTLQLLGSMYQLLALAVLGGTYGAFLAVRSARRIPLWAPKIAVVLFTTALVAWLVLGPYLHTRAVWGVVAGRPSLLFSLADFTLGHRAYPGSIPLALMVVGLVDRCRGARARAGHDPRLPFLLAGLLVVWASVWSVPIPGLAVGIPSLFTLASRILPGLDAVRAGATIGFGAVLAGALLAGYGVLALVDRRSAGVRAAVTIAITIAVLIEVFHPAVATFTFGSSVAMRPYLVRPPAVLLDLYAKTAHEAVLDVPYSFSIGRFFEMVDGVFLSAFHLHPVGACYNSFKLPLHDDIQHMTERLTTDARAVEELHALGFGTLVVNELHARGKDQFFKIGAMSASLTPIGRAAAHSAYRLDGGGPLVTGLAALAVGDAPGKAFVASPPEAWLRFTFRNGSAATYRHPDPIEPARVRIRWRMLGARVREDETMVLLPLALAAEDEVSRLVKVPVPGTAGEYDVTLAAVEEPDLILARDEVHVTTTTAAPSPEPHHDATSQDMRAGTEPPP